MIGALELVVIALIILVIIGRNRLPAAGRSLGGGIRNLIDGIRGEDDDDPAEITASSESERERPPGDT